MGNAGDSTTVEEFGNGLRARLDEWRTLRGQHVVTEPLGALQLLIVPEPARQEVSLRHEMRARTTAAVR